MTQIGRWYIRQRAYPDGIVVIWACAVPNCENELWHFPSSHGHPGGFFGFSGGMSWRAYVHRQPRWKFWRLSISDAVMRAVAWCVKEREKDTEAEQAQAIANELTEEVAALVAETSA